MMKRFSDYLLENSLYSDQQGYSTLMNNKGQVAELFFINVMGFLSLYAIDRTQPKLVSYLRSEKSVRPDKIGDANNDMSLAVKMAVDAQVINQVASKEITKLLYLIKSRKIDTIDDDKIRDLMKRARLGTHMDGRMKSIYQDYQDGKTSLAQLAGEIYPRAKARKTISSEFLDVAQAMKTEIKAAMKTVATTADADNPTDDNAPDPDLKTDVPKPTSAVIPDPDPAIAKRAAAKKTSQQAGGTPAKDNPYDMSLRANVIAAFLDIAPLDSWDAVKAALKDKGLSSHRFPWTMVLSAGDKKFDITATDVHAAVFRNYKQLQQSGVYDKIRRGIKAFGYQISGKSVSVEVSYLQGFYQAVEANLFDPELPPYIREIADNGIPRNLFSMKYVSMLQASSAGFKDKVNLVNTLQDNRIPVPTVALDFDFDAVDPSEIVEFLLDDQSNITIVERISTQLYRAIIQKNRTSVAIQDIYSDMDALKAAVSPNLFAIYQAMEEADVWVKLGYPDRSLKQADAMSDSDLVVDTVLSQGPASRVNDAIRTMDKEQRATLINAVAKSTKISKFIDLLISARYRVNASALLDVVCQAVTIQGLSNEGMKTRQDWTDTEIAFVKANHMPNSTQIVSDSDAVADYLDNLMYTSLVMRIRSKANVYADEFNNIVFGDTRAIIPDGVLNDEAFKPLSKPIIDAATILTSQLIASGALFNFTQTKMIMRIIYEADALRDVEPKEIANRVAMSNHLEIGTLMNLKTQQDEMYGERVAQLIVENADSTFIRSNGFKLGRFFEQLIDQRDPTPERLEMIQKSVEKLQHASGDGDRLLNSVADSVARITAVMNNDLESPLLDTPAACINTYNTILSNAEDGSPIRDQAEQLRRIAAEQATNTTSTGESLARTIEFAAAYLTVDQVQNLVDRMTGNANVLKRNSFAIGMVKRALEDYPEKLAVVRKNVEEAIRTLPGSLIKEVYKDAPDAITETIMMADDPDSLMERINSPTYRREINRDIVTTAVFDSAGARDMIYDGPIRPLMDLDKSRLLQVLEYNDIKVNMKKNKRKKNESYKEYLDRVVQNTNLAEDIGELLVSRVDNTQDQLELKTIEYENYNSGRHGDTALEFLEEFDVQQSLTQPEYWEFRDEQTDTVMYPTFHGTGSVAASMILRKGFAVISANDASAVGRMLGNGIYYSNVLDKVAQYIGDTGFGRKKGTVGYIFEMEAVPGIKGTHHESAGLGGDGIRSPEWCVYNAGKQLSIRKAYKVRMVSTSLIRKLQDKHSDPGVNEGSFKLRAFSDWIHAIRESVGASDETVSGATAVLVFRDGKLPHPTDPTQVIDWDDFDYVYGSYTNVGLESSAAGVALVVDIPAGMDDAVDIEGVHIVTNTKEFSDSELFNSIRSSGLLTGGNQ